MGEIDEVDRKRYMVQDLTKAFLRSPNKRFADQGIVQKTTRAIIEMTDYCLISRHAAELVQAQGIQEKHEILQAEDRIQCQHCLEYAKFGEMYCFVGDSVTKCKHKSMIEFSTNSIS